MKKGIYVLDADLKGAPISMNLTSTDVNVYFRVGGGKWVKEGYLQGIAVSESWDSKKHVVSGAMIRQFLFDSTLVNSLRAKKKVDIKIECVDNTKRSVSCQIWDVSIVATASGLSVDDISMEEQITYIAKKFVPWSADEKIC